MRVFMKKLRVEIENGMRVYLESLDFEIEMRVSQKSGNYLIFESNRGTRAYLTVKGPERVHFGNESVHPWISTQSLFKGSS